MTLRRVLRWFAYVPAALLTVMTLYLLAAWFGSSLPRNADWTQPDDGIRIMIESNGVHTGIVMPVVSSEHDWRSNFPAAGHPRDSDGWVPTHVAIGWGEKEVFLNTPTWADLKASTVLRVLLRGGDAIMRVGLYVNPRPSRYHREMTLRPDEYRALVARIEASLPKVEPGTRRRTYESYERDASNFDALGRYTPLYTCNQWVSDVLGDAGIKTGRWTPLAGGVMKWVPAPQPVG